LQSMRFTRYEPHSALLYFDRLNSVVRRLLYYNVVNINEKKCYNLNMTATTNINLQLNKYQKAIEIIRPWILFLLYIITAKLCWWIIAIPLALITCLAAFVQMHDSIHRSLGLSKLSNEIILSLSALLLLKSGHCLQLTHLRHHGRCLK